MSERDGMDPTEQPAGVQGAAASATRRPAPRAPILDSQALLQGHRTVEIHHNGELYRLQATRQGKLILTK